MWDDWLDEPLLASEKSAAEAEGRAVLMDGKSVDDWWNDGEAVTLSEDEMPAEFKAFLAAQELKDILGETDAVPGKLDNGGGPRPDPGASERSPSPERSG